MGPFIDEAQADPIGLCLDPRKRPVNIEVGEFRSESEGRAHASNGMPREKSLHRSGRNVDGSRLFRRPGDPPRTPGILDANSLDRGCLWRMDCRFRAGDQWRNCVLVE